MQPPFDPSRSESLVRLCRERGFDDVGGALVSIEEFFSGNWDLGSIGCNLTSHPGVASFASVLAAIWERHNVDDVLLGVTDVNNEDSWPFSDRVYIITTAQRAEIEKWLEPLSPDDVEELVPGTAQRGLPAFQSGQKCYLIWWDRVFDD